MPWSKAIMSMSLVLLAALWLGEGIIQQDLKSRFIRFFRTPAAWVFVCIWLVHVIGMVWTTDMEWGLSLTRILLPILVIGVVLGTAVQLSATEWKSLLLLTALSIILSTVVCFAGVRGPGFRDLSLFVSHIRLSLLVCVCIAILIRFWPKRFTRQLIFTLAILWSLFFLGQLGSWLGAFILLSLVMFVLIRTAMRQGGLVISIMMIAGMMLIPAFMFYLVQQVVHDHREELIMAKAEPLVELSAGGEKYYHDKEYDQLENGTLVWTHVADIELRSGWERISDVPYDSLDARGQPLRATAIRYLASMGQKKDAVGLKVLNETDVERIEKGFTNVNEGKGNAMVERLHAALYEWDHYKATGRANGHTLAMRWEFWRTGKQILQRSWLVGVGTGDTQLAFEQAYDEMHSKLLPEWRLRAHNQYLTWAISFGIFGMLMLLGCVLFPAWRTGAFSEPLFVAFLLTFLISCITEDTLETQVGATFFAFFYGMLVFARPRTVAG